MQGSSTALTTTRLFNLLRINVKIANDNQDAALRKLQNGEIAALAFVAATPAPFFQAIDATDGLHLLSIPLTPAVASALSGLLCRVQGRSCAAWHGMAMGGGGGEAVSGDAYGGGA